MIGHFALSDWLFGGFMVTIGVHPLQSAQDCLIFFSVDNCRVQGFGVVHCAFPMVERFESLVVRPPRVRTQHPSRTTRNDSIQSCCPKASIQIGSKKPLILLEGVTMRRFVILPPWFASCHVLRAICLVSGQGCAAGFSRVYFC